MLAKVLVTFSCKQTGSMEVSRSCPHHDWPAYLSRRICCNSVVCLFPGHRRGVRLPGCYRSHHHARLRSEDASENHQLRQEQHFVEESEGCRRLRATSGRCRGVGELFYLTETKIFSLLSSMTKKNIQFSFRKHETSKRLALLLKYYLYSIKL